MLKVAILSDSHLGFGFGTERENDSFTNFELAVRTALKEEPQPQIMLLVGDIFHEKIPKQEVLAKTIELFAKINKLMKARPQVLRRVKDGKEDIIKEFIPPIIAIWGTHERRHTDSVNPVQILEKAGLLTCLHAESILVECGYDKIGIHGLSGVPDNYAKETLKSWNPKPFTECQNILMLHQNFKEVMPNVEPALEFSDLPKDFITLLGHIHSTSQHTHPVSKKPIIVVGSTVSTQLHKSEAEIPKGYYTIEFGREKFDFKFGQIRTRPFYYQTLSVDKKKPSEILYLTEQLIGKICKDHFFVENEKPILKIKLEGVLADGFRPEDLNLSPVMKEFEQKLILVIDKSYLESSGTEEHSKLLAEIRDKKLSIDDVGIEILSKNLSLNVDIQKLNNIFHLLSENNLEQAEAIIEGRYEPKLNHVEYVSPAPSSEIVQENTPTFENPMSQSVQEDPPPQPREIQPVVQSQPVRRSAPDPTTLQLAESGMSLLGMSGGSRKSSPAPVRAPVAPQYQPQSTPIRKSAPDPTTLHLAESGMSLLGMSSGSRKSSSAPAVRTAAPSPTPSRAPVVQTQAGKISSVDATVGLSMLASSDNKPKPTIRMREQPGGQTVQKIAGQPHAKPLGTAPPPRRWNLSDDEIITIKKDAFDIKKWLNKDK